MNGWCPMNKPDNVHADISKAMELAEYYKNIGPRGFAGISAGEVSDMARALIEQQSTLERYKAALEYFLSCRIHPTHGWRIASSDDVGPSLNRARDITLKALGLEPITSHVSITPEMNKAIDKWLGPERRIRKRGDKPNTQPPVIK